MEVKFNDTHKIMAARGLGVGGRVQQYIDSEVLRRCAPYLPKQIGELETAGILGTEVGIGKVCYNSPKARFLYYGVPMVGQESRSAWAKLGERKVTVGGELHYDKSVNPKAGKLWFERMKQDQGRQILDGAAKMAGGKAK